MAGVEVRASLRGIRMLRSFSGSVWISIRSTSQISNPTRVSAAVDSVARPCPARDARIQ